jgi:hypothetical protein
MTYRIGTEDGALLPTRHLTRPKAAGTAPEIMEVENANEKLGQLQLLKKDIDTVSRRAMKSLPSCAGC